MTRLKERLDRRVARMSDDAKITQEMAIDDEAKRRGMTRSAFLSSAARNEIEGRR